MSAERAQVEAWSDELRTESATDSESDDTDDEDLPLPELRPTSPKSRPTSPSSPPRRPSLPDASVILLSAWQHY